MTVNVRKLAAIDLHFLGPKVILTEFSAGVLGPIALGLLTLRKAYSYNWPRGLTLFGAYLLCLGLNYVPLLLHAIDLARSRSASREIADELSERRVVFRKYRRQSVYLLIPLAIPIAAFLRYIGRQEVMPLHKR
jgi:hypothetical protein